MDVAVNDKVEKLRQACEEAFHRYPKSCSHAVMYLIRQYKTDQPYLMANDLIDHLASSPEWQEVPLSELSQLANKGELVVGGAKEGEHGHIIGVYPGMEKPRGGFYFTNKRTGERLLSHPSGMYARAMSTSMGDFPGALSNGDKTVRDPWGELAFKKVRFWKYVGASESRIVSKQRWDTKKVKAIRQSVTSSTSNITTKGRRWRLETDSADLGIHRGDYYTRWQR